jgi:hydrogenase-4 component F
VISLALVLVSPLVAAALAIVVKPYRRYVGWAGVVLAAIACAASLTLAFDVVRDGPVLGRLGDIWRVDALSAMLAACITFVALLASMLGPGLGPLSEDGEDDPKQTRRFRIFMNTFTFTMLAAVTTENVALMWVAVEATTIMSAIVIPLHRTKASVEASWKYILICSVGIALAFTGTVLAYFDFVSTAGEVPGSLNWNVLRAAAPSLHSELLQLAFAFILIGYGTKAGLAPMHTWLPDAHSEAPSPISAMMSGVLLAVAMYAIARWKVVVDGAVDARFTTTMLLGFGLLSVALGAFSLVIQRHYKRMLAYSSIEHMGLVSIGLALGPLGMFAAWLHVTNHAIAKSVSFLLAGRVLARYRSTDIEEVSGLLRTMPWTGALLAAGVLALVGLPPFGLFVSEFLLVRAAVETGHPAVAAAVLVLLLVAFVSLVGHLNRMLYGEPPPAIATGEGRRWPLVALTVPIALLIVLGVAMPPSVNAFIRQCVTSLAP